MQREGINVNYSLTVFFLQKTKNNFAVGISGHWITISLLSILCLSASMSNSLLAAAVHLTRVKIYCCFIWSYWTDSYFKLFLKWIKYKRKCDFMNPWIFLFYYYSFYCGLLFVAWTSYSCLKSESFSFIIFLCVTEFVKLIYHK